MKLNNKFSLTFFYPTTDVTLRKDHHMIFVGFLKVISCFTNEKAFLLKLELEWYVLKKKKKKKSLPMTRISIWAILHLKNEYIIRTLKKWHVKFVVLFSILLLFYFFVMFSFPLSMFIYFWYVAFPNTFTLSCRSKTDFSDVNFELTNLPLCYYLP